jgi:hypothetical protein
MSFPETEITFGKRHRTRTKYKNTTQKTKKEEQNGPHRKTGDEPNIIIQINKITHVNIVKQKITRNREH